MAEKGFLGTDVRDYPRMCNVLGLCGGWEDFDIDGFLEFHFGKSSKRVLSMAIDRVVRSYAVATERYAELVNNVYFYRLTLGLRSIIISKAGMVEEYLEACLGSGPLSTILPGGGGHELALSLYTYHPVPRFEGRIRKVLSAKMRKRVMGKPSERIPYSQYSELRSVLWVSKINRLAKEGGKVWALNRLHATGPTAFFVKAMLKE